MKKIVSVAICFFAVMVLVGCGGEPTTNLLDELRIPIPNPILDEEESTEETIEDKFINKKEVEATTSTSNIQEVSDSISYQATVINFEEKINSKNQSDLLEVARTSFAEEEDLIKLAHKCSRIEYNSTWEEDCEEQVELAQEIVKHPALTSAVIAELANSRFPEVWKIIASSDKADEETLVKIAIKTAGMIYYETREENRKHELEVANIIEKNPNTTDAVMEELTYSNNPEMWVLIASSNKAGEKSLTEVAHRSARLYYYPTMKEDEEKQIQLANLIAAHPKATEAVMEELKASKYAKVVSIAETWNK